MDHSIDVCRTIQKVKIILLVFSFLSLVACDGPTDPNSGPLLPDFSCQEVSRCSLTCTDRTTGGKPVYLLFWQADEQAATSAINPTFTWPFLDLQLVRVRLTVTDDDGNGERVGPVEMLFEICDQSKESNLQGVEGNGSEDLGATGIEADFAWIRNGTTIQFFDTSTPGGTFLRWDFGDGSQFSSARDPVHKFDEAGRYPVELRACPAQDEEQGCHHFEEEIEIRR
jgi:hypothetical protein